MRSLAFLSSSVGTKVLIAITGLAFFGFLVLHLAGNLLIFVGPESFNGYSHALVSNPLIYVAEAGLVVVFVVHAAKAILNVVDNRRARPARYALKRRAGHTSRKTLASTTMIVSGSVILVFLVIHLAMFKFGTYYPDTGADRRDLHRLVVEKFSHPGLVAFYASVRTYEPFFAFHGFAEEAARIQPSYCVCGDVYNPVCAEVLGSDGTFENKTFLNRCVATMCGGNYVIHEGECEPGDGLATPSCDGEVCSGEPATCSLALGPGRHGSFGSAIVFGAGVFGLLVVLLRRARRRAHR